jgi:hypothetical protein
MPFSIRPLHRLPLAYFSGLASLITLLVLSSGPAYAEWVLIGPVYSDGGYDVNIDPGTIRRKGDLVKMWILYDYKTIQTVENSSYLSSRVQKQFDCAEERARSLAIEWFSGNMGNGNAVWSNYDEGKWQPVAPGSVGHGLWIVACNKQ